MSGFLYRLRLLLEHKEEAKKEAERELASEEEQLQAQQKVLESLRNQELQLRHQREQARQNLLSAAQGDQPLSALEVQRRSGYVKELGQQIEQARKDVLSQQAVIEERELSLELAKERLKQARREVEILVKHRSKQEERFLQEEQAKEDLMLDEIGNVLYMMRRQ